MLAAALAWASCPSSSSDRLLDDVIHDVGGRVVDAARLLDLRFLLDLGLVAGGEADDLAEECS